MTSGQRSRLDEVDTQLEAPVDGWEPVEVEPAGFGTRSFLSEPDDDRIRARYFRRESDGALVGRVWFGPGAEGPPGHAHGGSTAAVMDELLGTAAWAAGHPVVAATITVDFREMIPLDTIFRIEAAVDEIDGRKIRVSGRLLDDTDAAVATGEGLFIEIDPEDFDGVEGLPDDLSTSRRD